MEVVAVLEIHMDRQAVGTMKPSIRRLGLVPGQKWSGVWMIHREVEVT